MNFLDNIGISFKANYLMQGDNKEKCSFSKKNKIKNIELYVRKDGKDFSVDSIFDTYSGNVIFNFPAININLENLNTIESNFQKILKYNVKSIIIKASSLTIEDYEWSTNEEQLDYISKIALGIATLASNRVQVLIENTKNYESSDGFFGQNLNQISDLLVYSRKTLVNNFKFSEDDANKYVKICFNVSNFITEKNNDINKWFDVLNSNIGCIKYNDDENVEKISDIILSNCIKYNIDIPILVIEKIELEEIKSKYEKYYMYIKGFCQKNNLILTEEINEDGFTNIVVISMIVLTILIGILMVYVKFNS